jgi:murein DD-endopeptidase MepM/ murein hydrolase activator NlpD
MNKFFILFLLLNISVSFAQKITDIDPDSQNRALLGADNHPYKEYTNIDFSDETFISSDRQIPAFTLYENQWDSLHLRSFLLNIPFYNNILQIKLVEEHNSTFVFPCRGELLKSFGEQKKAPLHIGIDFQLSENESIYCCFDGVVRMARFYGDYGNVVVIRHYNGLETIYAHLRQIYVKVNQVIKAGTVIGTAGNTGKADGCMLHFETRFLNEYFNPELMLDIENRTLKTNLLTLNTDSFSINPLPDKKIEDKTAIDIQNFSEKKVEILDTDKSEKEIYHIVTQGETLFRIAAKYKISVEELIRINHLPKNGNIQAGQKLKVSNH